MKRLFCVEALFALFLAEVMILLPVGGYYALQKDRPDLSSYVHMSQDIPRTCLRMGEGKAVDGYKIEDGKLVCLHKEK